MYVSETYSIFFYDSFFHFFISLQNVGDLYALPFTFHLDRLRKSIRSCSVGLRHWIAPTAPLADVTGAKGRIVGAATIRWRGILAGIVRYRTSALPICSTAP